MTRTGTYTLLIELARSTPVRVGALGEQSLREGAYAYTGSAFGSSDCACESHLAFDPSPERLLGRVRTAHQSARS